MGTGTLDQQPARVEGLAAPGPSGATAETSADVAALPNEGTTMAPHEGEPLGMYMDQLLS